MPRNITPPLVVRYSATDVPIIQLSLASKTLPDVKLNDYGQNVIRPFLATVQGAQVPYPYGGKPRLIMADLDMQALRAKNLTPEDVTQALLDQNLIVPSGTAKIGDTEYAVQMNNSTDTIEAMNDFPIKRVGGAMVFLARRGPRAQRLPGADQLGQPWTALPGSLMIIRKTGGESTLRIIDGILAALPDIRLLLPEGMKIKPVFNQAVFVKAALQSVLMGGLMAAALTGLMILLFLGNWRLTSIIMVSIPLCVLTAVIVMYAMGDSLNTMTLGGFALAVGILVDDATVVIENIERHLGMGHQLEDGIIRAAHEVASPTMVSTLAICVVFVPIFLLQGTSKYLFAPLAVAVVISLLASLAALLHPRARALQTVDERVCEAARRPRRRPPRRSRRRSSRRPSEPLCAVPPRVRLVFPGVPRPLPQLPRLGRASPGRLLAAVRRRGGRFRPAVPAHRAWTSSRRWMRGRCACTCARPPARAWKRPRRCSAGSSAPSARSSATTRWT